MFFLRSRFRRSIVVNFFGAWFVSFGSDMTERQGSIAAQHLYGGFICKKNLCESKLSSKTGGKKSILTRKTTDAEAADRGRETNDVEHRNKGDARTRKTNSSKKFVVHCLRYRASVRDRHFLIPSWKN